MVDAVDQNVAHRAHLIDRLVDVGIIGGSNYQIVAFHIARPKLPAYQAQPVELSPFAQLEESLYQGVNAERARHHLISLRRLPELDAVALAHSRDMVKRRYLAHESPEVMAIWEPMGALCEERDGRPSMEVPHVERMKIEFASV